MATELSTGKILSLRNTDWTTITMTTQQEIPGIHQVVLSNMTEGFVLLEIIFDDDGQPEDYLLLELNHAYERITGSPGQQIIGKTLRESFPEQEANWPNTYDQVALTGESCTAMIYSSVYDKEFEVTVSRPLNNQLALIFKDISKITERSQQEQTLTKTQQMAKVGSWQLYPGTDEVICSDELLNIFDIEENFTLETYSDAVGQDGRKQIFEDIQNGFEKGLGWNIKLQITTSAGTVKWILVIGQAVRDRHNKVTSLVGFIQDISAHVKTEHELCARQMITADHNQAPLATIEWNTKFEIVNWNKEAEHLFGYTSDEVKGRNGKSFLFVKSKLGKIADDWKNIISHGQVTVHLNEFITKNGEVVLCESYDIPLMDRLGRLTGVSTVILNKTAEYLAKSNLQFQQREQQEILDFMVESIITIDQSGTILTFNKASEILFGHSAQETLGRNVRLLMPEPYAVGHDGYLRRHMETGESTIMGVGRELSGQHKDGHIFPIHLLITELPTTGGGTRRFIGSIRDLTFSKHQEEIIRRSQKMDALGQLIGGIAHDYNNMLGVVQGFSGLLELELTDQPRLAEHARQITHASRRGASLTHKLLEMSRQKASAQIVIDINELLRDQRNILEKILTSRITLLLDLVDNVYSLKLEPGDLEDTVINMSINAMHATDGTGQFTIKTSNVLVGYRDGTHPGIAPGDYVVLSFTDTGSGMEDSIKEKIFDPFFTTKGVGGSGLGLSQVYGFIERSNGHVKVTSEPGHGSCFTFYFPRSHEAHNGRLASAASRETLRGSETILVVDDEPALLDLAVELLSGQGYRVLTAAGADQALLILESDDVDLLITDIVMPHMDGLQLADRVQQLYPHIKIQMVSGFADHDNSQKIDAVLYQNKLSKPYSINELLVAVRDCLNTVEVEG